VLPRIFPVKLLPIEAEHSSYASNTLIALTPLVGLDANIIAYRLRTLYGTVTIDDSLMIAIIQSSYFERLKGIRDGGQRHFCLAPEFYTRYDHSLGVFALVALFGGSREEQLAALLHDISHTVFSHTGGYFFMSMVTGALQDAMHEQFLVETGLEALLAEHNLSIAAVDHRRSDFMRVKKAAPDLCADNIDSILQSAVLDGYSSKQAVDRLLSHLTFNGSCWYFDDQAAALQCAQLCLVQMCNQWSSPENIYQCYLMGCALLRAAEVGLITRDVVVRGTDDAVWDILAKSQDAQIAEYLDIILQWRERLVISDVVPGVSGTHVVPDKFRGIDPYVLQPNGLLKRLTVLDRTYRRKFEQTREIFSRGWVVNVVPARTGRKKIFIKKTVCTTPHGRTGSSKRGGARTA
jgi:hypothetical protein